MSSYHRLVRYVTSPLLIIGLYCAGCGCAYAQSPQSLGGFPLCEASAAVLVKCENGARTCLLVADNEVKDELFVFALEETGESARLAGRKTVSLKKLPSPLGGNKFKLEDIEALAALPSGELMIFGSHSRNKRCKPQEERLIFAPAVLADGEIKPAPIKPVATSKIACDGLMDGATGPLVTIICEAIKTAEERADKARARPSDAEQEKACDTDPAFNLEGAVAVPDAAGEARIWVGLRAPLVAGKAVLARQVKDRRSFAFDAFALIDLNGLGIRELTFAEGKVWGIAGPAADGSAAHRLWSINPNDLKDDARIAPAFAGDLPPSSEGLFISGHHALVLIDGDQPKKSRPESCVVDSTYIVRRIP